MLAEQIKDPSLSFWLSAAAGTGKTYQLSKRAVELLLGGAEPDKLLCLTYTRNAAAEMRNRIFAELGERANRSETAEKRRQATELLINCIEAGGSFRVMTIHSFCEELLRRFPLEADIEEGFEVADDDQTAILERRAFAHLLQTRGNRETINCLKALAVKTKEFGSLKELIKRAAEHPRSPAAKPPKNANEDLSAALAYVTGQFVRYFEEEKRNAGCLSFDDLINKTAVLLERENSASWVNYKLDGGIEHILIDEAQDTSPDQWRVIEAIADDFFSGEGARERPRSVFVVGDEKQSIYSFQGANPDIFKSVKEKFRRAVGDSWREESLRENRRSSKEILRLVDEVFADGNLAKAIHGDGHLRHYAAEENGKNPTLIEVTSPFTSAESSAGQKASNRLAEYIGDKVAGIVRSHLVEPGEVMILLQRRSDLMEPIVAALRRRGVKTFGDHKKPMAEHLCVMDLMALGRFCFFPEDDYNLACLLKSPLADPKNGLGINESDLWRLRNSQQTHLWQALQADKKMEPQLQFLKNRRAKAGEMPPFEFYTDALKDGGENRLLRYVSDAERQTINGFLAKALDYEQLRPPDPSLLGFLNWLNLGEQKLPGHESGKESEFVRVMTVHGAKGLEASVVILADAFGGELIDNKSTQRRLFIDPQTSQLIYAPSGDKRKKAETEPLLKQKQLAAWEENQRLLYVALTRAKNRILICGVEKRTSDLSRDWYRAILAGANRIPTIKKAQDEPKSGETVRALKSGDLQPLAAPEKKERESPLLHGWLTKARKTLPADKKRKRPPFRYPSPPGEKIGARVRGSYLHKLFQFLPQIAKKRRLSAALSLAASYRLSRAEAEKGYNRATRIMTKFPALFGGNSKAEVDFILKEGDGWRIGRIDRLLVKPGLVELVDFKSGSREYLPHYLAQMDFYRQAANERWGRTVKTYILWTDDEPEMMEIFCENERTTSEKGRATG